MKLSLKKKETTKHKVFVRLTESHHKLLKKASKKNGLTITDTVRALIETYLTQK
tara:strand:- start:560 stop:721 length:162 start_codon:yes stop_codon:yes gene_type:complete